jgi:hypothetical protein
MNDLLHDAGCSLLSTLTNSALLDGLQKAVLDPTPWLGEVTRNLVTRLGHSLVVVRKWNNEAL